MKIAIPVADGKLCAHFGHCDIFAIIETDEKGSIISKQQMTPPPHEPGVIPNWLNSLGVKHVIAGGMGARAQDIFSGYGISIVVGASSLEPETLVKAYINGELVNGDNICDH